MPTSTPLTTTAPGRASTAMPGSPGSARVRRVARLAGLSYLLMFVIAIAANFVVLEGLVVEGDAAATTANIAGSPGVFLGGIVGFAVIVALDLLLSWALYVVFRSVNPRMARAMGTFRLLYTVVLAVAVLFLVRALDLATAAGPSSASQTLSAVETFQTVWLLGLVLFGIHLVLLGLLAVRSGFAPRILGVVLVVAGVAYVIDTLAHVLLPDYAAVAPVLLVLVAVPSMVGEGWLGVWLLTTRRLPR